MKMRRKRKLLSKFKNNKMKMKKRTKKKICNSSLMETKNWRKLKR